MIRAVGKENQIPQTVSSPFIETPRDSFSFKSFDSCAATAVISQSVFFCHILIWVKAEEVTSQKNIFSKDKGSLQTYFHKSGHYDSVLSVCFILNPQTSISCSCSLVGNLLPLAVLLKRFFNQFSLTDGPLVSLKYEFKSLLRTRRNTFSPFPPQELYYTSVSGHQATGNS